MANENRRKLYNAMQQAGYDIGSYDDFDRRMNNPQDRVKFYDAVQEAGYDIGGFGDFENRIKGSKYKLSANGREFQVSEREYKDFLARRNGTQPQATPQPTPQPQKPTTLSPEERQAMARQTQGLVDASGRSVARGKAYLQGLMQKPTFDTEPVRVGAKINPNVVKQSSFNPETAEMEDTYLTQAGEFESEAMADFAQDEVDAAKKTNIERIDEQIAKLEAEKQRRSGAGGLPKGWGTAMYQSGMGVLQDNREDNDIDIALRDLRQAKTMYERNKQLHDSSDFLGGVGLPLTKDFFNNWKNFSFGVWDTLHDVGLYDFGVSDMAKAGAYNRIKNKLEKGEELSDHETDIAVAGMLLSAAQSETDLPLAYKTGEITANMAPFMAQMAANPASGLGKGLARKAVRKFGRDGIGAVAARVSARIGGNLAEAAVLSNTLQAGNVAADAMRRATGDTFINDENGEIKLGHYENDDEGNPVFVEGGEDMALYKAEVSSLIENFTELGAGGSINKLLGKAATSNIGTRLGLSRINDFVKRMGTTDFAKATKRFMEKTHWDGMIEEPLEEEYGIILNSLLVGDNKLSDLFDSEQQAEIFAGTMWFGGFMAAMNTAAYPISRRRMKNNLSKADTRGQFELGEDWESWKERIDNMGDSEVKGLLYGIREDEQLTEAQKNAIFDYTIRLKQYQGSNVAGMLMRIENNVPQDDAVIDDAYEQGASIDDAADKNKAKELYNLRLQTATEVLGESTVEMLDDNPIPTLLRLRERGEDAEIRAALDYVNAKYAYDGMIDRVKDDIDVAQQQADYMIRRRTNFTTLGEPTIIPVITQQDKRMYITDGEVTALEDGSIDLTNSNDDLIAVDEEGNVTFLSAKDIKTVEEQINPAQALEETRNNIAQELSKKEADEIDGVLPFNPNDVYQGADEQGTPLQITILQDNGDGNVIANVTGLGEGVTLPKQTIQSWVDGLRMANLQQEEAERLAQYEPAEEYDYEPTQDIEGYEPVEDYSEYGNVGNNGSEYEEYEQPFEGVTPEEAQAEAEQYQANRPAMEKIPVLQDAEGNPILNKKGRPQYQWTQAPVETTADALSDLNDNILVDARDTAQNMRKQADERLQKVKAQKVKGDDPIEEAESRKEIRNQVQAAQAEVDYWKNVTQEINRRMSAESARIQAEIEAKKTQEQKEAEEAERRRIAAELDAKEREAIRKEIEKDSKKRNEPYKPIVEAKKEMADDDEAMAILNDTEPRDLAEWVSSLIKPHSMLWQDENGQRGLQSELGLNRSDIQKFISLLAQRDNGGKPFAEVVDEIYSELPDAMKTQYTDQDVRNTLLDLFNEGSVQRMRNLAEEHRIEEAKAQYEYNRRREEEAELQAWADAFHLSPEERESFEAWMEEDTPIELSDEELAHIINIIDEQENEQQSGGSQEVGNKPDTRAEDTGNNELPSEQPRAETTEQPEQGSEDNAVEGENEPKIINTTPNGIQGLEGYDVGEVLQMVIDDINAKLEEAGVEGVKIVGIAVNGSRARGDARDDSDLDVVVEYEGDMSEDAMFNLINEEPITIEGVKVDVNPITKGKSGTLKQYMERSRKYDEEKKAEAETKRGYTITPTKYTTKRGNELDMQLITFDSDLTKEQKRAADKFARDKKGWYDRNKNGYMMRSEADAEELAKLLGSEKAVQEAQPISLADIQSVTDEAESKPQEIARAEQETDTNPTDKQKEAGNYKKGHVKLDGYDITIENPKGSNRSGTDKNGNKWEVTMNNTYGYIRGTEGVDGDHVDVFLSDNPTQGNVYVVDQVKEDGSFDEHKVMYGFNSEQEAREAYLANYSKGWKGLGTITGVSKDEFKKWINSSHRKTKPFADYKSVNTEQPQEQQKEQQKPPKSKYVSDEDAERFAQLKERLRQKLLGQMNMGIDPEIFTLGVEMTYMIVKNQARKFADYAKAMIEEMGDAIRPYLKAFYNGARELPELEDIADELTPYEEVRVFDVTNFDKEGAKDLIKTAEVVAKEDEANNQAETAKETIKGNVKNGEKPNKKGEKPLKPTKNNVSSQQTPNLFGDLFGEEETLNQDSNDRLRRNDEAVRTEGVRADNGQPTGGTAKEQGTGGKGTSQEADGTQQVRGGEGNEKDRTLQSGLQRLEEQPKKNVNNNHAERGKDYAPKGVDGRIEANIAAIELMKQLIESGKKATRSQMSVLRKFSGWGGLGKAFQAAAYGWSADAAPQRLRKLLTDEEYEQAELSRNSAFYTPAKVIDSLWDIARALGFKGGNVLEGSAGIGNIIGAMPTDMSERSNIHAVELDGTTGNILSLLYPDAKVDIQGFEQTKIPNGSVDLCITNVPFGDIRVKDETGDKDLSKRFTKIHDFCIAKNIRKLREGGIGIFITTSGTLDNSQGLRDWIVGEGNTDVVGAFRMHKDTFGGASVTSDIIVVRKRVNGKKSPNAIDVSQVTAERTATYTESKATSKGIKDVTRELSMDYNKYFIDHPEMMGGEMAFNFEKGDTYRGASKMLFPAKGINQEERLKAFVESLRNKDWESEETPQAVDENQSVYEELGDDIREGSMFIDSKGNLCVASYGRAVPLDVNANKVKGHTKQECFKAYSKIKDAVSEVLAYQIENTDDKQLKSLLDKLNKAFDDFTNTYGHFYKNLAISFLRNDMDYSSIAALETAREYNDKNGKRQIEYKKGDIFSKRVVEKDIEPKPKTTKDGVLSSIYKFGRIDLQWMASVLPDKTEQSIKEEIINDGLGFENPVSGEVEVNYEYLSGNVREKLRQAIDANDDGRFDTNIKALRKVVPMNIPSHLIEFTLGSSWLPAKLYEDYIYEKTGISLKLLNTSGTWVTNMPKYGVNNEKNRQWSVESKVCDKIIWGHELMMAALQNKTITVQKTQKNYDGTTETISDKEATAACSTKIDEIRQDFKDWARDRMQNDTEISERVEEIYNERFNNYVPKSIPDMFVPEYFGGASRNIHLRPHQAKAAIRSTTQPIMLAHEVGTGKTFTLITAAMEMRRLGTARKPMIVVQNATVGQFVESAKELYPNAKILTLEEADRSESGRKAFYAKIRYNDWDMVVIPQSTLDMIPDSEERQIAFVKDKIDEKLISLQEMQDADVSDLEIKQAQSEIEKLEGELSELSRVAAEKRKKRDGKKEAVTKQNAKVKALEMLDRKVDDVENFDEMGIDAILVDEAHSYKHLGFATAMQRGVKGIDPSYSKKSQGLYLKCQSVMEKTGGKNVVFATGTPISNTAAEIWTFMRYLMPKHVMEDYGIYYFDDFVRNFGNLSQMLEFQASGRFKENNRFAGYVNLPELVRIWSGVADTVLTNEASDLKEKIPEVEGGKAQDLYLPQTRSLRSVMKFVKDTLNEFENMTKKEKKQNSHIPLVMYGIAKAAAVDARLVLREAEDEPNSKTNEAVRQTLRSLKETESYKGTVAIFADVYQNKESGFNLYEDIKKKLIENGVPENQIVVMSSGMSIKKKLETFDKVNSGEVRVILGSTFTLGTGVNIQERLHTLIHLDAPVRPMDYTQRNGRILRQGNIHKEMGKPVRILRFGVEDSLDVTAYQRLKTKGAIADSIMHGSKLMNESMENRTMDEEEDVFGDTVAQLSGSQYALLKQQAEREVRKLEAKERQHKADQTYIHNKKPTLKGLIQSSKKLIESNEKSLRLVESRVKEGKPLPITIGQRKFNKVDAMDEYFKEYNKKTNEEVERMRKSYMDEQTKRELPINIGGFDFVVRLNLKKELERSNGSVKTVVRRNMVYSCAELELKDIPVKSASLKNGINDIIENVLTGNDFRERIEAARDGISRNQEQLALMEKREGKPFEFAKELEEARARYDEYEELMKKELEEKEAKYAEMDANIETASDISGSETSDELYRLDEEDDEIEESPFDRIRQAVNDIIDKLHIADRVTILESTEGLKGKKARAKGWFDVSTGKIVVVLPNNRNAADAMRTILHEAVAHMGLRELFGKEFNNFLMDVYSNASESIRRKINANAAKKGWDIREATEEYLASLAETQNFEQAKKQGIWNKVKQWFNAMLDKVGIPKLFTTSYDDNELRYILWRSWRNLTEGGNRDYIGMAEDVVMQDDLKVGEYARDADEPISLFGRDWYGEDVTLNDYYEGTEARFEPLVTSTSGNVDAEWDRLKAEHPDWELHESPKSTSEYLIDRNSGDIYRKSDHWGKVATCSWKLNYVNQGAYAIGKANIKDFKRRDEHLKWYNYANERNQKREFMRDDNEPTIQQGFGSAATSLRQVPAGMRKIDWKSGTTNVDIGGGRFDEATRYLDEQGVENLVFDPFNRDAEHNREVAERVRDEKADTATCHNVLNVIDSEQSRANVILQAAKAIKPDGTAYFTVYEGNKSGVGRQTMNDSWQNNRPTKDYVSEIERYFADVTVKNNVIIAKSPIETDEQSIWDFNGEYEGNDIRFREDEEIEPTSDVARTVYDSVMSDRKKHIQEAWQDGMISIKEAQDAVLDTDDKPLRSYEDAYQFENHMHGISRNEAEYFERNLFKPLLQAINTLAKKSGKTANDVYRYLMLKHGLERNRVFAERDARREFEAELSKLQELLDAQQEQEKVVNKLQAKLNNTNLTDDERKEIEKKLKVERTKLANVTLTDAQRTAIEKRIKIERAKFDGLVNHIADPDVKAYYDQQLRTIGTLRANGQIDEEEYNKRMATLSNTYLHGNKDSYKWRDYSGLMAVTGADTLEEAERFANEEINDMEGLANDETRELWKAVNAATQWTLRKSFDSGEMTRDNYEAVKSMFEYYVPLRGWAETRASDVYDYMGGKGEVFSPVVRNAFGRMSEADNPIAYIGNMAVSAIVGGNKNLLKQHLLRFAQNHPNALFTVSEQWYQNTGTKQNPKWVAVSPDIPENATAEQIDAAIKQFDEDMKALEESGMATKKKGKLKVNYPEDNARLKEHQVRVRVNGREYVIYVNGNPRVAQAINGKLRTRARENSYESSKMANINRIMAQNFTSRNPAFIFSNASRDLNMAMAVVGIKEGWDYNKKFYATLGRVVFTPRAVRGGALMPMLMGLYLDGKIDGYIADTSNDKDLRTFARYFKEFMTNGGETGFTSLRDVDTFKKTMQKEYGRMEQGKADPRKLLRQMGEGFEYVNRCVEDMTRFVTYATSRQMGRSIADSVTDAKNVTLNFNRKGSGGMYNATFRNFYIFVNPAIQSLHLLWQLASDKRTRKAFTVTTLSFATAGALMPIVNAAIYALTGGGDDDDYWNLPTWVRRNNICFKFPHTGSFITIPLAQEFRVFYGLGELVASALLGHPDKNAALSATEQVTDLLPISFTGANGNLAVNLSPTLLQPLMQVSKNVDFTGKPIRRITPFNENEPAFQKAYRGTPSWMVKSSELINELTGGNEHSKGWIEGELMTALHLNYANDPAVVNHILKGYFGGMYSFISGTTGLATTALSGDMPKSYEVPILNRFLNIPLERTERGSIVLGEEYYGIKNEMQKYQDEVRGFERDAKKGDIDARRIVEDMHNSDKYKHYKLTNGLINKIEDVRNKAKYIPYESARENANIVMGELYDKLRKVDALTDGEAARLTQIKDNDEFNEIFSLPIGEMKKRLSE